MGIYFPAAPDGDVPVNRMTTEKNEGNKHVF
jgi:hypothetical protein